MLFLLNNNEPAGKVLLGDLHQFLVHHHPVKSVHHSEAKFHQIYGMPRYNRIKIVLAEQDKSSSWLAEQVGRNKPAVSRRCSNSMQPNVETLFKIAEVLEVDVRELLVGTRGGEKA